MEIRYATSHRGNHESKNGDNPVNTELFKGFFEDTLNQEVLDKIRSYGGIAFLHLDVDLYESYMCTLTRLWDSVNPGGVVLFDEYHPSSRVKYPGAYKAINKFLLSVNLDPTTHVKTDKTGKCYVISLMLRVSSLFISIQYFLTTAPPRGQRLLAILSLLLSE